MKNLWNKLLTTSLIMSFCQTQPKRGSAEVKPFTVRSFLISMYYVKNIASLVAGAGRHISTFFSTTAQDFFKINTFINQSFLNRHNTFKNIHWCSNILLHSITLNTVWESLHDKSNSDVCSTRYLQHASARR